MINLLITKQFFITDEYTIYHNIVEHEKISKHHTINHSKKQYAIGKNHVNNCENRHSLIRPWLRMFRGVSKRYLFGYAILYQYIFNYKDDAADKILETLLNNCNIKGA